MSGVVLSAFYSARLPIETMLWFDTEIVSSYLVNRIHVICCSLIFLVLYGHVFKALLYKLFCWENRVIWWSGVCLLYLIIVEAFTGYVLPWGQMSFWGATVITNLFSILPLMGQTLIEFIWGGSCVSIVTLQRFFVVHYLVPSIIVAFILLHLTVLHKIGSTEPKSFSLVSDANFINLYPYFISKDLAIFTLFMTMCAYLVSFDPFIFDNLVNNIKANSLVTPKHIVPEWYFLPFYCILKMIKSKIIGIIFMLSFIMYPVIFPIMHKLHFMYNSNRLLPIMYKTEFIYNIKELSYMTKLVKDMISSTRKELLRAVRLLKNLIKLNMKNCFCVLVFFNNVINYSERRFFRVLKLFNDVINYNKKEFFRIIKLFNSIIRCKLKKLFKQKKILVL